MDSSLDLQEKKINNSIQYKRIPLSISLLDVFPKIRPLSISFYQLPPYSINRYRRVKLLIILGSMCNYPPFRELSIENQDRMIRDVEKGCLNITIRKASEANITRSWGVPQFKTMYQSTIVEVSAALDCENSTYLMMALFNGRYKAYDIASLPEDELCKNDSIRSRIQTRHNTYVPIKTTTLYECPRCFKKQCWFTEVQLRSGDEGKDTQLICCYCGYDWVLRN